MDWDEVQFHLGSPRQRIGQNRFMYGSYNGILHVEILNKKATAFRYGVPAALESKTIWTPWKRSGDCVFDYETLEAAR